MAFDKIKEIIVEQLGVEESAVTLDTNLIKDLEADSLDAVEIIMAIEENFDIEIFEIDKNSETKNIFFNSCDTTWNYKFTIFFS